MFGVRSCCQICKCLCVWTEPSIRKRIQWETLVRVVIIVTLENLKKFLIIFFIRLWYFVLHSNSNFLKLIGALVCFVFIWFVYQNPNTYPHSRDKNISTGRNRLLSLIMEKVFPTLAHAILHKWEEWNNYEINTYRPYLFIYPFLYSINKKKIKIKISHELLQSHNQTLFCCCKLGLELIVEFIWEANLLMLISFISSFYAHLWILFLLGLNAKRSSNRSHHVTKLIF